MKQKDNNIEFSEKQLNQIRMVFNEGINELVLPQFDELRDEMNQRFDTVDQRFEQVDKRFDNHEARLSMMETDVKYLRDGHGRLFKQVQRIGDKLVELISEVKAIRQELSRFITREEFHDLSQRLVRVEKQLGLI